MQRTFLDISHFTTNFAQMIKLNFAGVMNIIAHAILGLYPIGFYLFSKIPDMVEDGRVIDVYKRQVR